MEWGSENMSTAPVADDVAGLGAGAGTGTGAP